MTTQELIERLLAIIDPHAPAIDALTEDRTIRAAASRITELQDEVVRLRRLIIESYKAREALSNTAWHARRYAMEDTSYEQFLAWLHWYCPPTFYPYPYKGDAVEIWHRGER